MVSNNVAIYTEGGFIFEGSVLKADKSKLILEIKGNTVIVMRAKIVAISDIDEVSGSKSEPSDSEQGKNPIDGRKTFLNEDNQRASFIPSDMLLDSGKKSDDDFSISFSSPKRNLTFKLEGDSE